MAGVARAVPPRASGRDDAADFALAPHPALEGFGHRPDRGAALAGEDRVRAARVVGGHVVRGDVGGGGPSRGREVDGAGGEPESREAVADVGELGPLRVEGAGDEHLAAAPEIASRGRGLPVERLGRGGANARRPGTAFAGRCRRRFGRAGRRRGRIGRAGRRGRDRLLAAPAMPRRSPPRPGRCPGSRPGSRPGRAPRPRPPATIGSVARRRGAVGRTPIRPPRLCLRREWLPGSVEDLPTSARARMPALPAAVPARTRWGGDGFLGARASRPRAGGLLSLRPCPDPRRHPPVPGSVPRPACRPDSRDRRLRRNPARPREGAAGARGRRPAHRPG